MDSEVSGSVVVRIPEVGDAQLHLCMLLGEEAEQRDKAGVGRLNYWTHLTRQCGPRS